MPNFKQTMTILAQADRDGVVCLSVTEALTLANLLAEKEVVALVNHADLVAFALTLPEVTQHLADSKKIHAIKALRAATDGLTLSNELKATPTSTFVGLKAAKDAVEAIPVSALPSPSVVLCPECGHDIDTFASWQDCPNGAMNHRG